MKIGLHFCIIQSAFFFVCLFDTRGRSNWKFEEKKPVKLRKDVTYVQQ